MSRFAHHHNGDCDAVETWDVRQSTPWHEHAHWVFGQVAAGALTIDLRQVTVRLQAGQGFVLAPGTAHRLVPVESVQYRVLCPAVPPAASTHAFACPIGAAHWHEAFLHGFAAVQAGRPVDPAVWQTLLDTNLRGLSRLLPQPVARVRKAMRKWALRNPSLEILARTAGCSPWHLHRLYTAATGLTPHQTLVCEKVRRARKLILSGVSLRDASVESGFADQSHLTRVFKQAMGLAPDQYIRQVSGKRF